MKHNDIMPECFIDTTIVTVLLDAQVSHKHNCDEVAKAMERGNFKDAFAVGIIDNDKRKITYIEGFEEIGRTDNLTFLKHKDKHQYVIKETFIKANVEAIGMKMEDFGLPSDLDELTKQTKDSISTRKDPRLLSLFKALRRSPEVAKLKDVLEYLAANKYNVDLEELKKKIEAR